MTNTGRDGRRALAGSNARSVTYATSDRLVRVVAELRGLADAAASDVRSAHAAADRQLAVALRALAKGTEHEAIVAEIIDAYGAAWKRHREARRGSPAREAGPAADEHRDVGW